MNKHILQWIKDEIESHGTPEQLTMSWDDLDAIWAHVEKHTNLNKRTMTQKSHLRESAIEAIQYLYGTGATEQMRRDDQYYVEALINYAADKLNIELG